MKAGEKLRWKEENELLGVSLSVQQPFLYVSEKAFAFQWCVSNSFTP